MDVLHTAYRMTEWMAEKMKGDRDIKRVMRKSLDNDLSGFLFIMSRTLRRSGHSTVDDLARDILCRAILDGKTKCVEVLAQLDGLDGSGICEEAAGHSWSPLHLAASSGHVDAIEPLVEQGADVNCLSSKGRSPLDVAVMMCNTACAEVLRKHGGRHSDEGYVYPHLIEMMNEMNEMTGNSDLIGPIWGMISIPFVSGKAQFEACQVLDRVLGEISFDTPTLMQFMIFFLRPYDDADEIKSWMSLVSSEASQKKPDKWVAIGFLKALIKHGALKDTAALTGSTAAADMKSMVWHTTRLGYTPVLEELLNHGACPNFLHEDMTDMEAERGEGNYISMCPLELAIRHNDATSFELLTRAGATLMHDPDWEFLQERTIMHVAAENESWFCIKYLKKKKNNCFSDNLNVQDFSGDTPLWQAVQHKASNEFIRELVLHGACPIEVLFEQARVLCFENISTILKACKEKAEMDLPRIVNSLDSRGRTMLALACDQPHTKHKYVKEPVACVKILLEHGATIEYDEGRKSALHLAAFHGNARCVKLLLKHGADADFKDQDGHTAMWVAQHELFTKSPRDADKNLVKCIDLLQSYSGWHNVG